MGTSYRHFPCLIIKKKLKTLFGKCSEESHNPTGHRSSEQSGPNLVEFISHVGNSTKKIDCLRLFCAFSTRILRFFFLPQKKFRSPGQRPAKVEEEESEWGAYEISIPEKEGGRGRRTERGKETPQLPTRHNARFQEKTQQVLFSNFKYMKKKCRKATKASAFKTSQIYNFSAVKGTSWQPWETRGS